jgi:hypothetical protein
MIGVAIIAPWFEESHGSQLALPVAVRKRMGIIAMTQPSTRFRSSSSSGTIAMREPHPRWMRMPGLRRHFPTGFWLGEALSNLAADFKTAPARENALSPLVWCLLPLTCVLSAAVGSLLGCELALGGVFSWPNLVYSLHEEMWVGLIVAVILASVIRLFSCQIVPALLIGNTLLAAGNAIATFFWVAAAAAC